jgi:hypothetical protein
MTVRSVVWWVINLSHHLVNLRNWPVPPSSEWRTLVPTPASGRNDRRNPTSSGRVRLLRHAGTDRVRSVWLSGRHSLFSSLIVG